MKPEELAVARGYIRRVRNISFREMTAVTYRILGLVAALGSPPFHSLRHLYWKGVTTEVAVRIKPYLLRSLNSVSMSFMLWDPRVALEFAAQLQALPQLCPHLTYLMLDAPNPIKRHSDALPIQRSTMQAIPKLRLLKTFKSMDLPFATQLLSALSPLTRLETIQLMFEDEAPALPLINNDAFPALETAIIDGTFKACAQFVAYLRPIVPSRLITISLNICDEPSPRDLLKLGKSVRDVLGGSLKQFRLGGPAGMAGLAAHITNAPNAKKTFDRIILRPLYDCKHLIYLTVPIWNDFSEKDEDLLRQAQEALPESKKVNLGPLVLVGPDPVLGIPTNLPIKFVHITAGGEMTEISLAGNGGDVVPGPEPEQAGQD